MSWKLRQCYHCAGDVYEDQDDGVIERRCLQCGRTQRPDRRVLLAIDPGQTCGYAVVSWSGAGEIEVHSYGEIPVLGTGTEMLLRSVQDWLDDALKGVDHVAWEGPIIGARSRIEPHEVRGVLWATCLLRDKPHSQYLPMQVKATLTGSARASKSAVAHAVRTLLNLPRLPTDHASDALAIAVTHLVHGEKLALAHLPVVATERRKGTYANHRKPA